MGNETQIHALQTGHVGLNVSDIGGIIRTGHASSIDYLWQEVLPGIDKDLDSPPPLRTQLRASLGRSLI